MTAQRGGVLETGRHSFEYASVTSSGKLDDPQIHETVLPADLDNGIIMEEARLTGVYLGNRNIADLINEPDITNPKNRLIAKLLKGICLPAYSLGNKNLLAFCILKGKFLLF